MCEHAVHRGHQIGLRLVRYGNQLGQAFVTDIPDWSAMDQAAMETWYNTAVTIPTSYLSMAR